MDLDAFAVWLEKNGVPAQFHQAYRDGAQRMVAAAAGGLVRPKHVDEIVNRAGNEGASGKQMANLQRIGDALIRFEKESQARLPPPELAPAAARNDVAPPIAVAPPTAVAAVAPAASLDMRPPDAAAPLDVAARGLQIYVWSIAASAAIGVLARVVADPASSPVPVTLLFLGCAAAALYGVGRYVLSATPALGARAPTRIAVGLLALAWAAQLLALLRHVSTGAGDDSIAVAVRVVGMIVLSAAASMTGRHIGAPSVVKRGRLAVYSLLAGLFLVLIGAGNKLGPLGLFVLLAGLVFHVAAVEKLRENVAYLARESGSSDPTARTTTGRTA